MLSGCKRNLYPTMKREFQKQEGSFYNFSVLLELAASDNLVGFRSAVEEEGLDVDEASLWYGRRIGSKKMGFEVRTPLMISAMFGSMGVLEYVLKSERVDVNRACGSDGATALHCATAGGSSYLSDVVKRLLDASADAELVDASGNRPGDLIAPVLHSNLKVMKKTLDTLKGSGEMEESCLVSDQMVDDIEREQLQENLIARTTKDGTEKKEYPADLSLPDINHGIYGTDEFRMYAFKIKPCSRAYSHDWTECPFAHPGENAKRRDPRKYHYSCVPCPEFRKGSCRQGDACEYAHGIFECWLHPAQYRTRLCKDETGCTRRVCFFAHKPEELRPLYASTGSAVPSPRSFSMNANSLDMGSLSPLSLGSSSVLMPQTSTPPMTPSGASSPIGANMWHNQSNIVPPALQLPGSRLKASLNARDMDFDMKLLELENHRRRQLLSMNEISDLSSPSSWSNAFSSASAFAASPRDRNADLNQLGGVRPTNLEELFGSLDSRQNSNQPFRSSYTSGLSSSPGRTSPFGNLSGAAQNAVLNSKLAAFAKRSQSFIDRSTVNHQSGFSSPIPGGSSALSNWGSPDGKLDWGIQGADLNKLRKSASMRANANDPNTQFAKPEQLGSSEEQMYHINTSRSSTMPAWLEQLYMEQEQMVA